MSITLFQSLPNHHHTHPILAHISFLHNKITVFSSLKCSHTVKIRTRFQVERPSPKRGLELSLIKFTLACLLDTYCKCFPFYVSVAIVKCRPCKSASGQKYWRKNILADRLNSSVTSVQNLVNSFFLFIKKNKQRTTQDSWHHLED